LYLQTIYKKYFSTPKKKRKSVRAKLKVSAFNTAPDTQQCITAIKTSGYTQRYLLIKLIFPKVRNGELYERS
jgi:hypothetical protein